VSYIVINKLFFKKYVLLKHGLLNYQSISKRLRIKLKDLITTEMHVLMKNINDEKDEIQKNSFKNWNTNNNNCTKTLLTKSEFEVSKKKKKWCCSHKH